MNRIKDVWRARHARKARINQQLAEADAADRMAWVRRDIPEQATAEQMERIVDMIREEGEWGAS